MKGNSKDKEEIFYYSNTAFWMFDMSGCNIKQRRFEKQNKFETRGIQVSSMHCLSLNQKIGYSPMTSSDPTEASVKNNLSFILA